MGAVAALERVERAAHRSVFVPEILEWLQPRPGGCYVDGTLGGGGHAEAILTSSSPDGRVVALDRDEEALVRARKRLAAWGDRVQVVHASFSDMREVLKLTGTSEVDGVVLDLGWSSDQMEDPLRGLSMRLPGPLDMRLDRRRSMTAATLLAESSEQELEQMFRELADEPFAKRIAKAIVEERREHPLVSTSDLVRVVVRATPAFARHGRRHVATRAFQALRMAVNDELTELDKGLEAALQVLCRGGRLAVISFHSGEDRIVKHTFLQWQKAGRVRVLTAKPWEPSAGERQKNPRSRSAKLRVAEKQ